MVVMLKSNRASILASACGSDSVRWPVVRGLCFDLFNTLVNVAAVPAQLGRFTADILGVTRTAWNDACFSPLHEICRPSLHVENIRVIAHSIDPAIPDSLIRQAVEERQQRFDAALQQIAPDVLEVLNELRQRGYRLALVSNASSAEIRAWHRSPLASHFDTVVFSCDCGARKPQPSIYREALARLELAAGECLFIGDGGSNEHFGAHAVGMRSVLLKQHLQPDTVARISATQGDSLHAELEQLQGLWGLLERVAQKL